MIKAQVLIEKYKVQGRQNVSDAILDFEMAVKRQSDIINFAWLATPHYCPNCKKTLTDYTEYAFAMDCGECLSCDHLKELK